MTSFDARGEPCAPLEKGSGTGEADAQRLAWLEAVVRRLPVGVTVETASGETVLANDEAAARLAGLSGQSPPCGTISAADTRTDIVRLDDETTLMRSSKHARILGETLTLSTFVDITERMQAETELSRRAFFDELTGLPNRSLIREHVEAILRNRPDERFALAFIDVDNFKHINDFYSHAIGDALLVKFAQRIADNLRATDVLARISGDEFVLVMAPVESRALLESTVDRLLEEIKRPFFIDGFEVFSSASIGVSVYPEHGGDYEALRRSADAAMYRVKNDAKGGAAFFDLAIGRTVTARMELEQRLRLAIRDRRFRCAFQPKVDIRTHEVIGVEALIRWRDADGEIQGPSDFISLAVELGLIDEITHLVLAEAVAAMDMIDATFGPDVTVSVNVAAKQAGKLSFMRSFADALSASGHAERFMVEVTEDAFVAKSRFQAEILPMLRAIGVKVSIDDFGTGYSSLSALADITAYEIKVDRSFITDIHCRPRSQSVLKAIESLANALGMVVVAEGVETFEELAYLQAATRIRYAQGFYFARPFFLHDAAESRADMDDAPRALPAAREAPERRGANARGERYAGRS